MTFAIFHDFPGLENGLSKFHDFPWPGGTLSLNSSPPSAPLTLTRLLNFRWAGVEQSIIDDITDQWRRGLHACLHATAAHIEYSHVTQINIKLSLNLLLNKTYRSDYH